VEIGSAEVGVDEDYFIAQNGQSYAQVGREYGLSGATPRPFLEGEIIEKDGGLIL
tara:strand:- start:308 stop:472 length:165 start_codon:yes stop_codon:yes gene_type:complete